MALNKAALSTLLLFTAIVGGTALSPLSSAMAQDKRGPLAEERHRGGHIEGHIAFLRAELGITPAQEELWGNVVAAMRADAADFERLRPQVSAEGQARPTALQHLEERAKYAALRAKSEQRFLDAFRPLYEKLSDAQKAVADELLGQWHEEP